MNFLENLDRTQLIHLGVEYGVPLLKALAILIVGWVVAKLLSKGVKRLLGKTEIDNKIAEKLTGGKADKLDVEKGVSQLVYGLVLLFALMGAFQSLGLTIVTEPLNKLLTEITGFVPQLLAALTLGFVAWAVATLLRRVVTRLLSRSKACNLLLIWSTQ